MMDEKGVKSSMRLEHALDNAHPGLGGGLQLHQNSMQPDKADNPANVRKLAKS